jgi:uncharacterized protein (DUF1499 family)
MAELTRVKDDPVLRDQYVGTKDALNVRLESSEVAPLTNAANCKNSQSGSLDWVISPFVCYSTRPKFGRTHKICRSISDIPRGEGDE